MKKKLKKPEPETPGVNTANSGDQEKDNSAAETNEKRTEDNRPDTEAVNETGDASKTETAGNGAGEAPEAEAAGNGAGEKEAAGAETDNKGGGKPGAAENAEATAELKKKLADAEKQSREYLDRWQRSAAEFENYKRRTQNEMERMYASSAADVIAVFLPVVDSIERAVGSNATGGGTGAENRRDAVNPPDSPEKPDPYKEGLILIERQILETLRKLDVKPLPGVGEQFDPNLHEAVMHIEDGAFGQNVIAEVFRQGYIYRNKVVRHSVVKVAN